MGIIYTSFRLRPFVYIAFLLAGFIIIFNFAIPAKTHLPGQYLSKLNRYETYHGKIISWPQVSSNRTTFILRLNDGVKIFTTIRDANLNLTKGMSLRVTGKLKLPPPVKNPGEFDFGRYLSLKNIYYVMWAAPEDVKITGKANFYHRFISNVRDRIISAIYKNISGEQNAAILTQMLIGRKEDTTRELKPFFIDAGVMHILVISGLHVGYIVIIFWYFFRLFGLSRKNSAIAMLPFLWTYVSVTGSNPPVVRSAAMATIIVLYLLLERSYDLFQALGLAATLNLIANPKDLFNPSFQLSYVATLGIMYLTPKIQKPFLNLPWPLSKIGQMFCVSTSAQLFSGPLIAYYFNKTSLIALLSNLFVVPWVGLVIAAGILLVVVDVIFEPLAAATGYIVSVIIGSLIGTVKFFSNLPGAGLWAPRPSVYFFIGYYCLLFVLPRFFYSKFWKVSGTALIMLVILILGAYHLQNKKSEMLVVTFLSLEGNCVLLEFPNGKKYLIDGGGSYNRGDVGERKLLPFLRYKNIKKLDRIFITTPELPSYGGLISLIDEIKISEVCVNPVISTDHEYLTLMESLEARKIPVVELWAPQQFSEGKSKISILNPLTRSSILEDNVLVILVEHEGKRMLLTGNMSESVERKLSLKKIDIVQIPRRRQQISKNFIKKLSPDYAIISTAGIKGAEKMFGDIRIFNTHKDGAVTIYIGKKIKTETVRNTG